MIAVWFCASTGATKKPTPAAFRSDSITLMTDGCTNFRKYMIEGTEPNRKKIAEYLDRSLMLVTALAPKIGYLAAAELARAALAQRKSVRQLAMEQGLVSAAEAERLFGAEVG